ncbi:hypothetical protein [Natrononativus amylolyticus]|uniref:hypothetical protein n=1 Tax=Natrononativus amylolyticus TaxID=2963434 RepID=UPI0020CC241A|nr:hypothetical protein [Natrononativus amylolyticus]
MRSVARILAVVLVAALALGGLSTVAVADTGASTVEQVGSIDLSIEDRHVHVDGADVSGEGLPSIEIDERTYTVDSLSFQSDGLTFEYGDTTYEICSVDITLENVGITVTDSSVGGE